MSISDRLQQYLDAAERDLLGSEGDSKDDVEYANSLLNRAAGTIHAMSPPGDAGHLMVIEWLEIWIAAAKSKLTNRGAGDVSH